MKNIILLKVLFTEDTERGEGVVRREKFEHAYNTFLFYFHLQYFQLIFYETNKYSSLIILLSINLFVTAFFHTLMISCILI